MTPHWSLFLPAALVYSAVMVVAWWVMQAWAPRSEAPSTVFMVGMLLMLLLLYTLGTIILYGYIVRAYPLSGKRHR